MIDRLRTDAETIRHTIGIVIKYFKGDTDAASTWLNTNNPDFENKKPIYFLYLYPLSTETDITNLIHKGTL
jgi:hypothetical protein